MQVRLLGCLMEKERVTPDAYPLTMNGLLAAANQTSNRNPVVRLEEHTVANALENLRGDKRVRVVYSRSNRADRYRHVLDEALGLGPPELALLCMLMLRGAQTASELRARCERLHSFASPADVDSALRAMAEREQPLVSRLARQPGQKEPRWAQTLGGDLPAQSAVAPSSEDRSMPIVERLAVLEARVDELFAEVAALREAGIVSLPPGA
ncbi:MAG: YceH family protein [Acidimicrobiales bacterium]